MNSFNIPILLTTYKRHDTTLKVLEVIKTIQASKLYISSNHWKNDNEKNIILSLREKIQNSIDWDCQIHMIIRSKHLSIKDSISSAIDILFQNEDMGIILEDDIVPNQSFFRYCHELLLKYKDNPNIFTISGWSGLDFNTKAKATLSEDYYFSKYNHIWGWATWKRAWQLYKGEFQNFEQEFSQLKFDTQLEKQTWYQIFSLCNQGKIDTWDHYWTYTIWKNNGLNIYPKNNMITNIGLNRSDATNTKEWSKYAQMKTYELNFPMHHPKTIERNIFLDKKNFIITTKNTPLWLLIINKIYRTFFKKNLKEFQKYMR
ncbi:methyltransferase FkbM [Helicobacter cholecystus]|uniref:Methyltransferase FkbM n=1 Tax=Helicobacter cholecystus TaxID=45498 RepID=A0A3D8IVP2_9HELI|nr:methyltransferase FkbM [Helicobacter cholecystus]RDU68651.1 methyltransferase FkbM [Helicobacter cholecystus]VEJ24444.1 methyltransferase [Helicobacter cholecystus]